MNNDITVATTLDDQQRKLLDKLCRQFDALIDDQISGRVPVQTQVLRQIGSQLWSATDLDADLLIQRLEQAKDVEQPLRLVFSDAPSLMLPWELLFHGDERLGFLAQNPWCCVMRRTAGSGSFANVTAGPLRILLFVSSPENLDPETERLDYEREEELLFEALDRPLAAGDVEIDVAEDGAIDTLFERLSQQHYHAVILSMHGTEMANGKGDEADRWGLLFEDPKTWRKSPLAGGEFVKRLDKLSSKPDLILLSACRSGKLFQSQGALTSVARQLHEAGVRHVIGMRLVVMDTAASAFSAELFSRLADGNSIGRSVSLARRQVAGGAWLHQVIAMQLSAESGEASGESGHPGDLFGQWTIPVLLDRLADGPLVDRALPFDKRPAAAIGEMMAGDGSLTYPARGSFIGRRRQIRQHLRGFLTGTTGRIMLTGAGGVGKTTLAGWFARRYRESQPQARVLGFQVPFAHRSTFNHLYLECSQAWGEASVAQSLEQAVDQRARIELLLGKLAADTDRPLLMLLDNLEDLQDLSDLSAIDRDSDSFWFLTAVLGLPQHVRVLLTGRYQFSELDAYRPVVCALDDAPFGDVLRKMNGLGWPTDWTAAQKRDLHKKLGGNHRALEWLAQLLTSQPKIAAELVAAMEHCQVPPNTPAQMVEIVLQAMRENLLLTKLLESLDASALQLLRRATLLRVPAHIDAFDMLSESGNSEPLVRQLQSWSLLQSGIDPLLGLEYFVLAPIVSALVSNSAATETSPEESQRNHAVLGRYFEYQGRHVSRTWMDDVEAIYHYRRAGQHSTADELANPLADHFYRFSNYGSSLEVTGEIVARDNPPPPWWALNRHGLCLLATGQPNAALDRFLAAQSATDDQQELGTTLNNISQIYKAKGDYDTALEYLTRSLKIIQQIGVKRGEGATLGRAKVGLASVFGSFGFCFFTFTRSKL